MSNKFPYGWYQDIGELNRIEQIRFAAGCAIVVIAAPVWISGLICAGIPWGIAMAVFPDFTKYDTGWGKRH